MKKELNQFCYEIAKELWVWCTSQNRWLSVVYIPGKQNSEADNFSRIFSEAIEWNMPKTFVLSDRLERTLRREQHAL